MNKCIAVFFLSILHYGVIAQTQLPEGFITEQIAGNLDPTAFTLAPDGRIFIAIKSGQIAIVENNTLLSQAFLSIAVDNFNERGLSGIVLDPDFEFNNYLYVYYTVPNANRNRVSRFTANGNFAVPGSEHILLELDPMPGDIHNAGAMQFGKDGKLYIATGDGAHASNAQSLNNLLGKILRINKDGSIPEDNPFYGQATGNNRAIFALGFRNPFSMDIHPQNGQIIIGDVGGSAWEEINLVVAGGNYGWPTIEGKRTNQTPPANYHDPVYAYSHAQGCAITGLAFYHPDNVQFPPEYTDKIFFADYCQGYIKVFDMEHGQVQQFATNINRPIAIKTASDGEMYYLARAGMGGGSQQDNTSTTNGSLWKVQYTGSGEPFISSGPQSARAVIGETVKFEVSALGLMPLHYQWQENEADITGANASVLELSNVSLDDDGKIFRCIVSNSEGEVTSNSASLEVVENTRPVPVIHQPLEGALYRAGDLLYFEGSATDAEDGELSATSLTWQIDFHHDDHAHPGLAPVNGISNGSYEIPRVGEISDHVWYRVYLTATDNDGFSSTVHRNVQPVKTNITVNTEPPGLLMNIDGQILQTPVNFSSVVGITRTFEAFATLMQDNKLFMFDSWQNGSKENILSYNAEEDNPNVIATYTELPLSSGEGLVGFYFSNQTRTFNPPPTLTRIDDEINFNWGGGSPAPEISSDFFTVRWKGEITPLFSGYHTFYVTADDGIRLRVNNFLIIDKWVPQAATEWTGVINLEAEKKYLIQLDYFEDAGAASIKLEWSTDKLLRQVVPKSQLHPDIILSTEEDINQNIYELFPSIVEDQLTILMSRLVPENKIWLIYNGLGQEIMKGESIDKEIKINLIGLKPGIYLFRTGDYVRRFYKK